MTTTSTFSQSAFSSSFEASPVWALASAPPVAGRADGGFTAQSAAEGSGAPAGATQPQGSGGLPPFFFIFLLLIMFMFLTTILGGRKEKKRRAQLLSSIKRHDRIQTVGGIIGVITEVRDDEVVLKIDEATNTKIRIVRSAVQSVLKSASSGGPADQAEMPEPEKIGV